MLFFYNRISMFNIKKYNEINEFLKKTNISSKIVAISKNHPRESVLNAISCGVHIFGENRVQEAQDKFQNLKKNNSKIQLHLTGPLQSNKVKIAVDLFDVFHTLDREKIAKEFSKHRDLLKSKKIFLQNIKPFWATKTPKQMFWALKPTIELIPQTEYNPLQH